MRSNLLPLLLLSFLLAAAAAAAAGGPTAVVNDLTALRSQSPTGVIHLTDSLLSRILALPTPRPFSLLIFFDAASLHSKPDLHLPQLRNEFGILSTTFETNFAGSPSLNDLFFFTIEFQESQSSFALFGVNSLPHVRLLQQNDKSAKDSVPMDQSSFSRLADSMAEFVTSKTGLDVGEIIRPPPVSSKQIGVALVFILIASPFVVKRVLRGDTIVHDPKLWGALSVFVYFFSVSGTMHNIIRKMPMVLTDRENPSKLVFFYQGSGMQLGAEGFIVGGLYTMVGLMLAFVTHVLVKHDGVKGQRGFMFMALFVAYWAVSKVIYLDNWKTGYSIHAYWPSSWN